MNRNATLFAALLLVTLIAGSAGAAAATPAGADRSKEAASLPTSFTLLTGSPEAAAGGSDGVLLVPGTVIPVSAEGPENAASPADARAVASAVSQGRSTTDLAEKLRKTLRLAAIDVQYHVDPVLDVDQTFDLPVATPGSSVLPRVTLLGFNDSLATYRVRFTDGSKVLADTSVSVPLGHRSVVGGLDGPSAPYLFLVVEPSASRPLEVAGERITPPRAIEKPAPTYPESARKAGVQGVVVVQVVIEKDGTISHTRVLRSLDPDLDRAALDAIRRWRFEPARLDGKAVTVYYNLTINYRLSREPDKAPDQASDRASEKGSPGEAGAGAG